MKPITAVIFDMDGTMVNSLPYHMESWKIFFMRHGINMTQREFDAVHHGTIYDIMPRIFGSQISTEQSKALGEEKESIFRELYSGSVVPTPGLLSFIHEVKNAGLSLAVATAADEYNARFTINALGLQNYFDVVVTSTEVKEGKPSPAVYEAACEQLGKAPNCCCVFEDTVHGVQAAVAAGMAVVGITTSHAAYELQEAGARAAMPDFTAINIDSLQSLIAI